MQIKERGSKVIFLRFIYDEEKKRTVNRSAGTQDIELDTLSDDLRSKMSVDEIKEAEGWLAARAKHNRENAAQSRVNELARNMRDFIKALDSEEVPVTLSRDASVEIYKAWNDLALCMRSHGHKRPRAS
jgi:hypothetical protein